MRAFFAFCGVVWGLGSAAYCAPICAQAGDVGLLPRVVLIQPQGEPVPVAP